MHLGKENYTIRLFFDTYEYKHKLIYTSSATSSCRNFYSTLLPEQRKLQSLLLAVASEVQVFGDASAVVAGGEGSSAGIQPC